MTSSLTEKKEQDHIINVTELYLRFIFPTHWCSPVQCPLSWLWEHNKGFALLSKPVSLTYNVWSWSSLNSEVLIGLEEGRELTEYWCNLKYPLTFEAVGIAWVIGLDNKLILWKYIVAVRNFALPHIELDGLFLRLMGSNFCRWVTVKKLEQRVSWHLDMVCSKKTLTVGIKDKAKLCDKCYIFISKMGPSSTNGVIVQKCFKE